ncbi:hypothetical protein [Siccirubricoccus sp. G192]|uniref:hypothetical protein n=1 Tax=Siccirubricoccus sp. G192 TaxID=2849651 RepID=UPI001C2B9DAA|nr:hypothetical protein [Siccirubricoccus sp. G192]MBV1795970.1 hypothetical protein [Siccirubricoccus sp. G192]
MAPRPRPLLALLAALPAACANPGEQEAAALRLAVASSRASLAALAPEAAAPGGSAPAARLPVGFQAPPAPPRTLPMPSPADPARPTAVAQLLGAGPEALRRWLGEPALRRAEGSAEIWLYASDACALDLVLYPEAGRLRAAHAAARANGTGNRTEAACLGEIGAAPGAGGSGAAGA